MPLLLAFALVLADPVRGQEAPPEPAGEERHPLLGGVERVLFLGDSITEDGRYIAYLHTALMLMDPEAMAGVEFLNLGLSAETVSGLSEKTHRQARPWALDRIDAVIEQFQPQLTFICYGMNDAIYHPSDEERFEAYRKGVRTTVEKLRAAGSLVVLMTPPVFDAASSPMDLQDLGAEDYGYRIPYRGYSSVLQEYGWWILSQHEGVFATVDLYEPLARFIEAAREDDPDYKYGDGVHPGDDGHLVMALSILEALDVPLPQPAQGTLEPDADGTGLRMILDFTPQTLPPFISWPTEWDVSPFASGPTFLLPDSWGSTESVSVTETREGQEPVTAIIPVTGQIVQPDLANELPVNQDRFTVHQTLREMHRALGRAGRAAVSPNAGADSTAPADLVEARAAAREQVRRAAAQAAPARVDLLVLLVND